MTMLSIVVPSFNEEESLPETTKRLLAVIEGLKSSGKISLKSNIFYIDDGSTDTTWAYIEEQASQNSSIHGIKLSHNRGHQNALLAGLHHAKGDVLISIDADLQDDTDMIEAMIDSYHNGHDIVYGVRNDRANDTLIKRLTAETFYRILKWMGVDAVFNHADYRLMSRRAIEALKNYPETNLFLRGIIPTIGFPTDIVEYARKERKAGTSKYPMSKMFSLAINGITSFSVLPLRLIALIGVSIFLGSILLTFWALWIHYISGNAIPGWTSSVLPIYFLGGVQLFSIGVVGEYVGKIYLETKRRPRYFIEKEI